MMGHVISTVMAVMAVSLLIAATLPVVSSMFVVCLVFVTFAIGGVLFLLVMRKTLRFILTVFVWLRVHVHPGLLSRSDSAFLRGTGVKTMPAQGDTSD
jgi:hypothetical protein